MSQMDRDRDPELLKGFFIYYCDSCTQPRIKHDSLQLRCVLSSLLQFLECGQNIMSWFTCQSV